MKQIKLIILLVIPIIGLTSCSKENTTKKSNVVKASVSQSAKSITSATAQEIQQNVFSELAVSNPPESIKNLGINLLIQRSNMAISQERLKLENFSKAFTLTYLTLRNLSLNSFNELGFNDSQMIGNISFFVDLENRITNGESLSNLQAELKSPIMLLHILSKTKFQPEVHEYSYLTGALTQLLASKSNEEVLDIAIPFAVYMRIIRFSNYPVTSSEETTFINYLSNELRNGADPIVLGNFGIQALILNRAMRLGYVMETGDLQQEVNQVVAPLLTSGKSADQIVGELVNNISLYCGVAMVKPEVRKKSPTTKIAFSLSKLLAKKGRSIASVDESEEVKKLISTYQNKNTPIVKTPSLVKLKNSQLINREFSLEETYIISLPKTSYSLAQINQTISDIKKIVPNITVIKIIPSGINAFLAKNLAAKDLKALGDFGYTVTKNEQVKFQNLTTCPASQFSNEIMTTEDVRDHLGANTLHARGFKGQGVKMAILDTGIEVTHEDFRCPQTNGNCRIKVGTQFSNPSNSIEDSVGHGTHVTSIAAGNKGMAPESSVVSYKINSLYDVIEILGGSAITENIKVINMSFSFPEANNSPMALMIDQVAVENDILTVAATGNCSANREGADSGFCSGGADWDSQGIYSNFDSRKVIGAPGIAKRSIAVGVTDKNDSFQPNISLAGPTLNSTSLLKPDLVAPGRLICAAGARPIEDAYQCGIYHTTRAGFFGWCDASHAVLSGSSMSSAVISGGAALLRNKYPQWNTDEVKSALRMTSLKNVGNLSQFTLYQRGAGRASLEAAANIPGYPPVVRIDTVELVNNSSRNGFVLRGSIYDRDQSGNGLRDYRILIGKGDNPQTFTHLKTLSRQVGNLKNSEVIVAFDQVPTCLIGNYTIKIEATDNNGLVASDYTMVSFY